MSDGIYDLDLYPGRGANIQLFNPDGTPFVIPTGTTIASRACTPAKVFAFALDASIVDAPTGMIRIALPNTPTVKGLAGRHLLYDVMLTIGGSAPQKFLDASRIKILYSPSQR